MRFKRAITIAIFALPFVALFVNLCGSLHNSQCGAPLTFAAYSALLPSFFVSSLLGVDRSNDYFFWTIFLIVTFVSLTLIVYGVSLALVAFRRRDA